MGEWKEYKFSDFVDINPSVKILKGIPVPFVEMKDLDNSLRYCESSQEKVLSGGSRFMNGDTLFARITPCLENGKICQVRNLNNGLGFGSTEFHVFRGKDGVSDTDFVYYLSRWDEVRDFAEHNLEGSSGRQRVSKEVFDNLYLTLPSLDTQCRIASILTSLDDKIDLLRRENATLEAMAETLFSQWFVVEAKEEWEEGKLGDYVELVNGVSYKGDELQPSNVAMVTLKSFDRNGGFRMDGYKEFTGNFKKEQVLHDGDLVVAHTDITQEADVIGNPAIVISKHQYETITFSMDVVKVVSKSEFFSNSFLYYLMKTQTFKEHCLGYANGSTVLHLSKKAIPEFEFRVPPIEMARNFQEQVESFDKKIINNNSEIQTLIQTRDGLLPRLMSGEIRIKN